MPAPGRSITIPSVQPQRSMCSTRQVVACIGLVLATPVAACWLMDLIAAADHLEDPDYAVRPLQIDPTTKLALGILALAVVVGAILELALFEPARQLIREWWSVIFPLVSVGIICGTGWAIMTAPVIGANIGAGMIILTAPPVVVALLTWAAVGCYGAIRRRRPLTRG